MIKTNDESMRGFLFDLVDIQILKETLESKSVLKQIEEESKKEKTS